MRLTPILIAAAVAISAPILISGPADAKRIEQACLKSDRRAASRAMCSCIQRVADQVLTVPDQRLAASFFTNPDRAQEVRMSDSNSHEQFWARYKIFGNNASAICR